LFSRRLCKTARDAIHANVEDSKEILVSWASLVFKGPLDLQAPLGQKDQLESWESKAVWEMMEPLDTKDTEVLKVYLVLQVYLVCREYLGLKDPLDHRVFQAAMEARDCLVFQVFQVTRVLRVTQETKDLVESRVSQEITLRTQDLG